MIFSMHLALTECFRDPAEGATVVTVFDNFYGFLAELP
jgi:hypothetical protein